MLVDDDLPHAKVVLADRGYDSDHIRNVITSRGGTPVIMGKANRKVPILVDTITYALRNRVERWCASRPFGSTNSNAPAASQHATIKPPQAISASLKSSPLASGSRVCQRDLDPFWWKLCFTKMDRVGLARHLCSQMRSCAASRGDPFS